jgi:hypothetical protein
MTPSVVPLVMVHPDDVGDLPAFKAQAARQGASVVVSAAVPRGQHLLAPRGTNPEDL